MVNKNVRKAHNPDFNKFRDLMRLDLESKFGKENIPIFWGNQCAKIVQISQAPSFNAVKNKKPFTDASGKKLREKWYNLSEKDFYNKNLFYFTALGQYYPGKNTNGTDKRPSISIAKKWLLSELQYLTPKLYLILGAQASNFFFPNKNFSELVFKDLKINNIKAYVLPHPSPLNVSWFKKNPQFETAQIQKIKKNINKIISEI